MKVSIIVFEINEIDGLRAMMPQIRKEWYDELLIIDGGSTDGSIEYAKENGYNLVVQKGKGAGAALNESAHLVTGDIVILYAPDGSFEPEKIPLITERIKNGNDIVNVSRYYGGTKSLDDTIYTSIGNWVFTRLINLFSPFKFTDFLYTYVGYRRSLIEDLNVNENIITWNQILMIRAIKAGYKIIEIPGIENPRIGGKVKVKKVRTAFVILYTILREYWLRR